MAAGVGIGTTLRRALALCPKAVFLPHREGAAAEAFVHEQGGRVAWFNARRAAEGFYAHMGYRTVSEEFDVPGIGPHVVMEKRLAE